MGRLRCLLCVGEISERARHSSLRNRAFLIQSHHLSLVSTTTNDVKDLSPARQDHKKHAKDGTMGHTRQTRRAFCAMWQHVASDLISTSSPCSTPSRPLTLAIDDTHS